MAARTWQSLDSPSGTLMVHSAVGVAGSGGATPAPAAPVVPASTAVLVHDFPVEEMSAERTGASLPALADRLAVESGWRVVAGCLRGVGGSTGDFSPCSWLDDLGTLVDHGVSLAVGGGVWLVGFGVGGSMALCLAARDGRVRGVACLAAEATLEDWGREPRSMLEVARRAGVVRTPTFPPDVAKWGREFSELRPDEAAGALGGRPLLILHGAEDDEVPVAHARQLADAAGPQAELHVLPGAGHRLRADPRAMALLVGWLERQGP